MLMGGEGGYSKGKVVIQYRRVCILVFFFFNFLVTRKTIVVLSSHHVWCPNIGVIHLEKFEPRTFELAVFLTGENESTTDFEKQILFNKENEGEMSIC